MVRLREIPRTATFAWSPDAPSSWIATGTKSGAVDVDFSNETCLELWDLALENVEQSQELQPSVTLPTETGFHDLAWTPAQAGHKRGIIAGAFDNGSLGLWDADKAITNTADASIFTHKIHSGAIKALQFNPKIQNFLATGGAKGELFISDLNHLDAPIRLGSTAARADDIDCLDWNKRVSNILVTGSSGGFVTVWDMKTRKESLTLNNFQRKPASAIAWDPEKPTRLITAVPLEQEPSGDLTGLCEDRVASARTEEEKADWKVIETLVSKNPRAELVKYLGFEDTAEDSTNGVERQPSGDDNPEEQKPSVNGASKAHKRFQSIFASSADGDFLAELAATKGTRTNNPFQIYTGSESQADRKITRALILGQFEKALDVCLQENRMSDAFMIAICGGEACIKKAQEAYLAKQSGGPNYLRLLASVVGKNLWDTVHNAELANWKEVMATLCTFADEQEFPDLCEALGDRIEEQIDDLSSVSRKDASFCFLAGSKLEKVVAIWIQELKEHEEAGASEADASSAFSLHARGLQDFIEKVTIFRQVVNFKDEGLSKTGEWRLEALYGKYLEYADIVAGSGQLDVAQKYLDLLPASYPGADVARSRIQQARKKTAAPAAVPQAAPITTRNKPLPGTSQFQPPTTAFTPPTPQVPTPYGASHLQPSNPYAPPTATSAPSNPYAPVGGSYQPPQQMRMPPGPPPTGPYGIPQANPIQPPPRYNQSPAIPPPSQDKGMSNWNDIPEGFVKPPTSRRGTPSVPPQPAQNPFSPPPGQISSPPAAPPLGSRQRASPVPPPPKGTGPPPRVTSPLGGQPPFERPSSASNPYAPPAVTSPPIGQNIMSPPIPRGPSPYNAPPSHAPTAPNRYAPASGSQHSTAPNTRPSIAPPPQSSSFQVPAPPMNPYAPTHQSQPTRQTSYGPPQPTQTPQSATAPPIPTPQQQFISGPPPAGSGPAAQGPPSRPGTAGSNKASAAPSARKYPKGDRTHISPSAQPIYTILSSEMARVKARAPQSFKAQVVDTEKRLDILFDHLNNEDLLKPDTVAQLVELAQALEGRDFVKAQEIQMDVHTNKVEECGHWMVGVKRLVGMCRATP
ncbi:hypothetical protein CLAIMM_03836 isoform 1 [Cladophialophora immunda]|nr:hypothetical protein CLAIMM_03836 isoform 1 [Cladophialophora immunda]